LDCFQLNVKL